MGKNIKRIAAVALAVALAAALASCTTQVVKESKSSVSVSDTSASLASSSSSASVSWTSAATAEAAAKGAGLSSFGAPTRTVIADFVFTNPAFAYTEHVAQATYEVAGSAKLIVRKAEGSHVASITDHEASEYSQKWSNTYEGYDVTSHGNAQGAASICVWNDGTTEYGVTIESLSNSSVTMDAEDLDDIVKAVKAANENASTQQASSKSGGKPAFDVSAFVWNNGLGEFLRYYWVQGENGTGYWGIVTVGADGAERTTYADSRGNIAQNAVEVGSVANLAASGPSFDVESFVWSNGLGQFESYYWMQGSGDSGCWVIVTQGADGSEYITYVDNQGNII